MTGVDEQRSLWQQYSMVADSRFHYRTSATGPLSESQGFDGKRAWIDSISGVPHELSRADRDLVRIVEYVTDGAWAAPNAPLALKLLSADDKAIKLEVRCTDGEAAANLELDAKTYLPSKVSFWGSSGESVWTFWRYQKVEGLNLATRAQLKGGDANERIVVNTIRVKRSGSPSFAIPKPDEDGVVFDPKAPKEVEVKRVYGYLMVRPKIDGKEQGWFFFDTGADVMVIDKAMAEKLDSPTIGGESVAGVVANSKMGTCKGIRFELGPLTLEHPVYFEMDLAPFSKALGVPIVGICGYDFISRAGIMVDLETNKMTISEPGQITLPKGAKWTPFTFSSNVPCVKCGFGDGRVGYFNLDTGSGSAVDFFSPAVEKYKLLEGRKISTSMTGGAGGMATSKAGNIEWFEFLGHRFENFPVGFQTTKTGVFASPFIDGNIGFPLIGKGKLFLDYRHSRLAVVRKPQPAGK